MAKRSSTLQHSACLSQEEINRVRDKFISDVDFTLEEAIQRHVSFSFRI